MIDNQEKSHNSISESNAGSIRKKGWKVPIILVPCHLGLSPQSSALSPQSKCSSNETLIKPSAPEADQIDDGRIFPELISDLLNSGHRVRFRAPGHSMYPTILHQDVVTVEPVDASAVKVGDIILYRVQQSLIAHRLVRIENKGDTHTNSQSSVLSTQSFFILRGDARPISDDPINAEQILGKVVWIERKGRRIDPYSFRVKLRYKTRRVASRMKRLLIGKG